MVVRKHSLKKAVVSLTFFMLLVLPGVSSGAEVVVLDGNSMWRFHETYETDVARLDSGELIRIDAYNPRENVEFKDEDRMPGKYRLRRAEKVRGSPFAPDGWMGPDFDDGTWMPRMGPFFGFSYRSLALLCVRGKFEVTDPAKVGELSLSTVFQGGVVVYLNGKEVTRASLPAGKLDQNTLAEDYPRETYASPDGKLIQQGGYRGSGGVASWRIPKDLYDVWVAGYKKRSRTLDLKIPAVMLRKGVNVLALEIHRAPGMEAMFATVPSAGASESSIRTTYWWNRLALESAKLSAPNNDGIVSNASRPKGLQVRSHTVFHRVNPNEYGDPCERLTPIRLCGARNGVYAGQVVVSSTEPIANLRAAASELRGPADSIIPQTAVEVRYPRRERVIEGLHIYDTLDASPHPAEKVPGNTQPVWVTVHVGRDARPGDYTGTLTVRVEGRDPVEIPMRLHVVDWTLPDPREFVTHVGIVQSPESVALQYNVPMWSEKHWQLLDRTFELLGQVGSKTLYIPVKTKTHFGNEHTMVRWVKQPDGSYRHDFSIVEKYLDVAVKHLGKVPVVCLYVCDGGPSNTRPDPPGTFVTVLDAATGGLSDMKAPEWGTVQSQEFWRPVVDAMWTILAKRGMEESLMVGVVQGVGTATVDDFKKVAPDVRWVAHSHLYSEAFGEAWQKEGQPVGYLAQVGGMFSVLWDPEDGRTFYGWKNPFQVVTFPRDEVGPCLRLDSEPTVLRLCAEGALLTGRQARYPAKWGARVESMAIKYKKDFPGVRGFGRLGADFWPVLKGRAGDHPICGRYPGSDWGTLNLGGVNPWLLAPGPEGAISTVRFELMRESLQEAEARVLIQNALLDDEQRAKLGKPLADRCTELMNERTRTLRYVSEFYDSGNGRYLLSPAWSESSEKLYEAAAAVAKALH